MRNRRIDNLIRRVQENLAKEEIKYEDIGFIIDSQKQYMNFFRNLDKEKDDEIDDKTIMVELAETYMAYRDNMNKGYEELKKAKENNESEKADTIFKNIMVGNLKILENIMEKSGAIEFLVGKHNKKYGKIDKSLETTVSEVKKEFEEGKLKRASRTELEALSAFWTNKFIKYIDNIEEYYMYIEDTRNLGKSKNIQEEDRRLYIATQKKRIIEKIFLEAKYQDKVEETIKDYSKEYSELFQKVGEKEIKLKDDYESLSIFELIKQQLYVAKDMAIKEIIVERINDIYSGNPLPEIKNWGVSEDSRDASKYIVTIELNGYMLPISLHTPKTQIREVLEKNKINAIKLPWYNPEENFKDDTGHHLGVNVMIRPSMEQQAAIRKAYKANKKGKASKEKLYVLEHIKRQITGEFQDKPKEEIIL